MDTLPINFIVKDRPCLVIGGGVVAARKATMLHRAGAKVVVVAPDLCQDLQQAVADRHVEWRRGHFTAEHAHDICLIIAATDAPEVNNFAAHIARQNKVLINVVDQPELCDFYMPAIVDRTPVMVAISSDGNSPVLARLLRQKIEALLPANLGRLATWAGGLRELVHKKLPTLTQRRRFWEEVLEGPLASLVINGHEEKAKALAAQALESPHPQLSRGEAFLVGAGPGDPELLTLRALQLMQKADVVLYDALVSAPILNLVRREAERVFVGKVAKNHVLPQDEINQAMVRLALEGKRVLRLKGGDPYIFGRGGEEIGNLAAQGIPFQVVPGVSAANGVAAYAGIPLTHRDYAQSVLLTTGHLKDDILELDWPALIRPRQTSVIYMGVGALEKITQGLMAHGLPATWPAAIVEQGTLPKQKVIRGTLANLAHRARAAEIRSPALIIVGEVVALRDSLQWFSDNEVSEEPRPPHTTESS